MAADSFKTQDYYKMMVEIMPGLATSSPGGLRSQEVPSLQSVVMMSQHHHPGTFRYSTVQYSTVWRHCVANGNTVFRFEDIMSNPGSTQLNMVAELSNKIRMDDACNIQFTSGQA